MKMNHICEICDVLNCIVYENKSTCVQVKSVNDKYVISNCNIISKIYNVLELMGEIMIL